MLKALIDAALDARAAGLREGARLAAAARCQPGRSVLVLSVERPDVPGLLGPARDNLADSRHTVTVAVTPAGERGKFENLNALLVDHPAAGHDWLIVPDDDVALPPHFLDRFLLVAERMRLRLAQPASLARRLANHPPAPRHRPPDPVRRDRARHRLSPRHVRDLLPFPPVRMGWGLDVHWVAVMRERGWPVGIVDATPIRHPLRHTGSGYAHGDAVAEARALLAGKPFVTRVEAAQTVATLRRW